MMILGLVAAKTVVQPLGVAAGLAVVLAAVVW
jgi:hypothetical protein